jgi:hypothetical protein
MVQGRGPENTSWLLANALQCRKVNHSQKISVENAIEKQ